MPIAPESKHQCVQRLWAGWLRSATDGMRLITDSLPHSAVLQALALTHLSSDRVSCSFALAKACENVCSGHATPIRWESAKASCHLGSTC